MHEIRRSAHGLDRCAYRSVVTQIWIICSPPIVSPLRTGRLQARCATLAASGLPSDALTMQTNVIRWNHQPVAFDPAGDGSIVLCQRI
jgi:hypothetical protein